MENNLDEILIEDNRPNFEVYPEASILVGSFLGGPLVGGYFLAENFKAIGQKDKADKTWLAAFGVFLLILLFIFAIPIPDKFPNHVIPITYSALAFMAFRKFQFDAIIKHLRSGGKAFGWGRIILISIIGALVTFIPIIFGAFAWDSMNNRELATSTYGSEIEHVIDYEEGTIDPIEVDHIANGLTYSGFFDDYQAKYVYLEKAGERFFVYINVFEGTQDDDSALQPFIQLQEDLDEYILNYEVQIKLFVDDLDNVVKTIE